MTGSLELRRGAVSGFLLRVIRSTSEPPTSRERVAERLGITPDYYAGIETGRRPFSRVNLELSLMLRQVLLREACDASLIAKLDAALEADIVIDHAVRVGSNFQPGDIHPLDASVLRRQTVELIAWPFTRHVPAWMPNPVRIPGRKAPRLPDRPDIEGEARRRFFDHLRRVADTTTGKPALLLRRQALYLLSFDAQPDAPSFLTYHRGRLPHGLSGWSDQWPAARSLAASITRQGDRTLLLDFIARGLGNDERAEAANLNYFAYWVGEGGSAVQRDDSFMPENLGNWRGDILLRHLTERIDSKLGYVDLTIHTLWALVAAKPYLLAADPDLRLELQVRVEALLDTRSVTAQAIVELGAIRYALKLHR